MLITRKFLRLSTSSGKAWLLLFVFEERRQKHPKINHSDDVDALFVFLCNDDSSALLRFVAIILAGDEDNAVETVPIPQQRAR